MSTNSAFERQLLESRRLACNLAYRILGSWEEVDDVVQEAVLNAWKGRYSWRGESAVSTWFARITINQALLRWRRRTTRDKQPRFVALDHLSFIASDSPYDAFRKQELHELLTNEIALLPRILQETIYATYILGMRQKDIALLLGISQSAVKSRVNRGLRQLRQRLCKPASEDSFAVKKNH